MALNFRAYVQPKYEAAKCKAEELLNGVLRTYIGIDEVRKCEPYFYSEARKVLSLGSAREKELVIATLIKGSAITPFSLDYEVKHALDFKHETEQLRLAIMRDDVNGVYDAINALEQIAKF